MDAAPEETTFGAGSYIDLLARDVALQSSFERQERWILTVVARIRDIPMRAARVELVLRPADIEGVPGFGVTWFVEGCGGSVQQAGQRWSEALHIALAVIMESRSEPGSGNRDDTMRATGE